MVIRKGLGKGKGSGYYNLNQTYSHDRKVHRDAGLGRKQPQRMPQLKGGYDMTPSYDSHKSFYGKADIRVEGNKKILKSYATDVAYIDMDTGKAVVNGTYSATTLRHIKEFLKQNNLKADTAKQIMKDYAPTKEQIKKEKEEDHKATESMMKTTAMVAAMGDIFGSTEKEKNDWKARMIKAGLGNQGLQMPDDWDTLSEETKKARLDAVIAQMTKKGGKRIRSGMSNGKPLFHQGDRIKQGNWSDKRWKKSTTKDNKQIGKKYESWEKFKSKRWM